MVAGRRTSVMGRCDDMRDESLLMLFCFSEFLEIHMDNV